MGGREAAQRRANGDRTPATTGPNDAAVGTMRQLLEQMKPQLQLALPRHMTAERMARQALTAFRTTPKLAECSPQSFLGALMTCAQVGLEPGPQGHVYILPFDKRGKVNGQWQTVETVATFIMGYQGMLELARRSDQLVDVVAHTVYQNEVDQGRFEVEYGTRGRIIHKPIILGERGDPVAYYATATLKTGGTPFVVLSKSDVEVFRRRSMTQRGDTPSGPWSTDYEPMAWKTCVRRLSRWLPQSPELAAALAHEESVREVVPGETVNVSVLDQQPPALEEREPADEPEQGSGVAEPEPDDGWPDDPPTPEPGGPDDPWGKP
jgi:recombination protein RecT